MIQREKKSFPYANQDERIVIGGVGQGADLALATLLRYNGSKSLGGVVAIKSAGAHFLSKPNTLSSVSSKYV